MNQYLSLLLVAGIAGLGMAFMPAVTKKTKISYSLIYVAAGALIYLLFPGWLPSPVPYLNSGITVHVTEFIVIISLMGAGIKLDRNFSWRNWSSPLRLIFFAMLLSIALCSVLGVFMLEFALPAALLIGAVLAPTDPVLAADVKVGPPNEKWKSETKFALTAEAGLNDGFAFPFTWLAIVVAQEGLQTSVIFSWLSYYLLYKIVAGLVLGWLCGKLTGYLVFHLAKKYKLLKARDGFLAVSLMLCTYGLTELMHGYGFIAVFICGLTLRRVEKSHEYHRELHSFTDQIERLLLGVLLVFFGGTLVSGILEPLTLAMVVFCCAFILLIRPLSAYLSLTKSGVHFKEKLAISFFGIRGMGSVYYLAFALTYTAFDHQREMWAIVALTLLLSIVMHGLTATSVMNYLQVEMPKEKVPE